MNCGGRSVAKRPRDTRVRLHHAYISIHRDSMRTRSKRKGASVEAVGLRWNESQIRIHEFREVRAVVDLGRVAFKLVLNEVVDLLLRRGWAIVDDQ